MRSRETPSALVLSGDTVFARMLVLELERSGVSCVSGQEGAEASLLIVDGDTSDWPADGAVKAVHPPVILFSRTLRDCVEDPNVYFLLRPFLTSAFTALVRSLLPEASGTPLPARLRASQERRASDELRLDGNRVLFRGQSVELTRRENALLRYLWQHRGEVLSRSEIIAHVWRFDYTGDTNVVDVYIRYLRQKLEDPFGVRLIQTVRGKGYTIP